MYFTNVHLLREIKEQTSSRNRLRDLLILLTRILALSALVFAFAQPFLVRDEVESTKKKAVAVFIDNSFSMSATKDEVPLLTLARDKAREIVASYDDSDEFLIITHDLEAKHQRFVDKETAIGFIDRVESTPAVRALEDIVQFSGRMYANKDDFAHIQYILSDFQRNISEFEEPIDSTVLVNLIPIRSVQESNVAIVDCRFEAPIPVISSNNPLVVEFENNGNSDVEVQLSLLYKGQVRPQGTIQIESNSTASKTIQIPVDETGWHEFTLKIDDFPIEFDDSFYGSFEIKDRVRVLSIFQKEANTYIRSAFNDQTGYELTQEDKSRIRYDIFQDQELIILEDLSDLSSGLIAELTNFVSAGGNLLVFPSEDALIEDYNRLLNSVGADRMVTYNESDISASFINQDEFIFNDVYENLNRNVRLPRTKANFNLTKRQNINRDILIAYPDDQSYLSKYRYDNGHVYLCASPLDAEINDLVRNAEIFIPMLYKMSISKANPQPLYYTIGVDNVLEFRNIDFNDQGRYSIQGESEFIPGINQSGALTFVDIRDQLKESGVYDFLQDGAILSRLSFNYNSLESDVRYGDLSEIESSIGQRVRLIDDIAFADLSQFVKEQHTGIQLWRWFLIIAVLFLLVETVLLRFWK